MYLKYTIYCVVLTFLTFKKSINIISINKYLVLLKQLPEFKVERLFGKDTLYINLKQEETAKCHIRLLEVNDNVAEYQDIQCGKIPLCIVKCNQMIVIKTQKSQNDYYLLVIIGETHYKYHIPFSKL